MHASCGATKNSSSFTDFAWWGGHIQVTKEFCSCRDSFDCLVLVSPSFIQTFGAEHFCMTGRFERTLQLGQETESSMSCCAEVADFDIY
jgi:hypothetical protein